jgi:lipopolysaccharide export LptBFGC system permease protein LptF
MVFTLQRYIFREAFKVFVLAAVALTLIMSLGSILRPVQEYGVGPRQVVHLMGYFLPITLTFVLPMAALFAAALVYGRFASDNELDACRASGISLLTLIYPGLALAIMVAIANLILSFHVVPAFVHRAQKSLKADAKQILFRNIQRRGYYELPPDKQYRIYADQANSQNDSLSGIVITENKNNEIQNIITAESAKVHFSPHERFNEVQITAYNTHQMGSEEEGWFFVEWLPLTKEFPSLLTDDIKFKKIDEMKKIRFDLMRFYPIEKLARDAYAQFTTELLAEDITTKIARDLKLDKVPAPNDTSNFYKLQNATTLVEFTARSCNPHDEKKIELAGEVTVVESDLVSKKPLLTSRCAKALLYIQGDELTRTLTMELHNAMWRRPNGSEGLARRRIIRGLILPTTLTDKFQTADVLKAVRPDSTALALQKGPSLKLQTMQDKLYRKIQKTLAEIKAEIHTRLVFGIGCVTLIMIGIGLGIILKGGHLLTAFGASSVPAAMLIVCIMAGKNITKNLGAQAGSGIILMWAGLALLSLFAVLIYRKLLKN